MADVLLECQREWASIVIFQITAPGNMRFPLRGLRRYLTAPRLLWTYAVSHSQATVF